MKISLVQTSLHWENPKANLSHFQELLQNVESELIVLPEMFTTGFSMNAASLAPENQLVVAWMKQLSQEKNSVVMGSFIDTEGHAYFNRLGIALPEGSFIHYDKRHLFRMAGEDAVYQAGNRKVILNWKGWNLCPLVCYDLRFPVWSRNRGWLGETELEYDLLIYVANWPAVRINAWDVLLKARAIENGCYAVGVNRTGSDGNGIAYAGHSAVVGPRGESLAFSEKESEVLSLELDLNELRQYRQKFPAHRDADSFTLEGSTQTINFLFGDQ